MNIELFKNKDVDKNTGVVKSGGAVHTEGLIRGSAANGGCDLENCKCSEGHWLSIVLPINNKNEVSGVTIRFENELEKEKFHLMLKDYIRSLS
jgi:hypothetical protein